MIKIINDIYNIIYSHLKLVEKTLFERTSKITINILILYLTKLISCNKNSSVGVASSLKIDEICTAKDSAYRKKRNLVDHKYINHTSTLLLNYYYDKTNLSIKLFDKYRVFACDGTYVQLSKNLHQENFKLTKNGCYVKAPINGIFDVLNNICIDFKLSNKSEQHAYQQQLHLFKENDIIIHDRGYYSKQLLFQLSSNKIDGIFRIKKSSLLVKYIKKNNLYDVQFKMFNTISNKNINFRVVRYTVNKEEYYLGTTLINSKFSVNVLKGLYKNRWNIEEYFKTVKYSLSMQDFHSKSSLLIKQEIYMHQLITIITRILEDAYIRDKNIKNKMDKYRVNKNNNISKVCNKIMIKLLIDSKFDPKKIVQIMCVLFEYLLKIINDRHYKRIAIKPVSKWYFMGTANK